MKTKVLTIIFILTFRLNAGVGDGGTIVGGISSNYVARWEYTSIITDSVIFGGLQHTALGQAQLSVIDSGLVVSNIGSSGEDGVDIELPQAGVDFSIQLTLYIRPTIDSLDATFRFAQWGKITGDDLTRLIGKQTIINISPDTSELWVDFDFIGADSVIIEVFNDSLLVGTETVLNRLCWLYNRC